MSKSSIILETARQLVLVGTHMGLCPHLDMSLTFSDVGKATSVVSLVFEK